jgi:hypothetical protein
MTLYTEQALKVVGLPNGLPVKVSLLLPNTSASKPGAGDVNSKFQAEVCRV